MCWRKLELKYGLGILWTLPHCYRRRVYTNPICSHYPSRGEDGNPALCVAPSSRTVIRSFLQWSRACQIYMCVFLLKTKMLKYMQTVRNMAERGANWQGNDESFRALRAMQGFSELRIVAERGATSAASDSDTGAASNLS